MANTTIPQMRLKAQRGPRMVYTWETKTGPNVRAPLPEAVNQPMYIPCRKVMNIHILGLKKVSLIRNLIH